MPFISKVVANCLSKAACAVAFISLFAISNADAQTDGGWTLNLDNTGYNPIAAGGLLPYAVRIDNNDNVSTPATTINFTIPVSTVFVGVDGLQNCTPLPDPSGAELTAPLVVTCDVPALAPNAVLNATVKMRPMDAGNVTLAAKIPNPGPSFSRMTTVEQGADLAVALEVNPATVQAGSNASFRATVTNNGPYPAQGAALTIPLPTGLSSNVTLPAGCSYAAPNIKCDIAGPIAVGASVPLDFAAQVTTENASTITVAAAVMSSGPRDPVNTNNEESADIAILPGTDVSIGKTRAPQGLVLVGDEIVFTLQPRLAGKKPTQATITDVLPANYEFLGVNASSGWTCQATGQTIGCAYAAGAGTNYEAPITITVRAIAATPAGVGVTNVATISSSDENADASANNSGNDGAAFIAEPTIDLVAQKSGPPRGLVTVGNSYDFTLNTRNDGNAGFFGELTITDHLPAGLTVNNIAAPAGWTCPAVPIVGPMNVVCTTNKYTQASPLGPTQQTGPIVLTTEVTATGSITNGMTVSFQDYDQGDDVAPGNNTTTSGVESADALNWADISVLKRLNPIPGQIFAGDPVTFEIEVVNAGPAAAPDVVLDDRLADIVAAAGGGEPGPADVTISIAEGLATGMSCSTPTSSGYSRDLQCILPSLPVCVAGSGDCPIVSVTVRAGSQGVKQNTAVAFSTTVPDNDTSNNTGSVNYTVGQRTDVTVSKVSPSTAAGAAAGQELVYVLTASVPRNGLSSADNVTLTDTLPDGLRFIDAVPSSGVCSTSPASGTVTAGGAKLVCNLGTINNGSQQTVTVRVVPTMPLTNTSITNNVVVATSTGEVDPDNNDAGLTIAILPPQLDLIVTKTDGPDPVLIGTDTRYTVAVWNSGPSDATNVKIVDTLPLSGLAEPRIAALPGGATCVLNGTSSTTPGGTVTCDIPHLPANSTATLAVDMKGIARGRHTNNVSVTSDETTLGYEAPTDNNVSYEDTTVRVKADLAVTKVPSVSTVDLRKEFSWTISVTNKSGPGLDVAEWVTLVDVLPDGMELTALPTASAGTCTGVIGQRNISCELGDIAQGATVTVTLKTKITKMSAQAAENSATATTLSFDQDPTDNTGTGKVDLVQGSSIKGTLYRDFNANDAKDAVDSGIASVTIQVEGTALHDGASITRSVTTDGDGNYSFDDLPPGTYSVYYGTISEKHLVDGRALAGTGAGTAVANGVGRIDNIVITNAVNGTKHDFTRVPTARIGLGKVAGTPVVLADGRYTINYSLTVRNFSLEPITGIAVSDVLNGASQNFGTNSGTAAPAEGQYRVNSVSTNFGSLAAGFNGATATNIVTGGTLAAGATGTLTFNVEVNPVVPRVVPALVHTNQAEVTGTGQNSGQTPEDKSHNNANPDPDGNGVPNEPANNTPTTVTPAASAAVTLAKTATPRRVAGNPAVGDIIDYTFAVTNTGNTPLHNVTVTDPLSGLTWVSNTPIARLNPGASNDTAFKATYALTQADIDRGTLPNTATVTGQWGVNGGAPVNVTDTDSATVPGLSWPGLTILKTVHDATGIANPTVVGNTIRYKFTVTNIGNTTMRNVAVTDALAGVTPDPVGAFTIGTMAPGAVATVYANYAVKLGDINAGKVDNSATASGVHGPNVISISTPPSTASVPLHRNVDLTLVKVLTSTIPSVPRAGDTLIWTVTATNTGNVTLTNLVVSDPFPDATVTPASVASLTPGATVDFTVTAPLTQANINAGEVTNKAKIDFNSPTGPEIPRDSNEVITDLPDHSPAIALTKVGDTSGLSAPPQPGEEIAYTIVIRNIGNVPLDNITLVDLLPGVVIDPTDAATLVTVVLQPQNKAGNASGTDITVNATYPLKPEDIDAGSVINTAVTTGKSTIDPTQTVTDRGGTTFETDDPTTTDLGRAPQIRLIKTITSAALSTPPVPGDVITYAFAVHNTGNVTLDDIELTELVSGVVVQNTSGWTGPLAAGAVENGAFTATYTLTQADIDRGSFANTAEVAGTGPGVGGTPTTVTDISGTDITNDTPVEQPLTKAWSLGIEKSYTAALSTLPVPGDVITYSFVVTNTGNVTLTNVEVSDPLADLVMPVTTIPTLLPGAANAVTLTATYEVKQSDIQAGEVRNTASVEGIYMDPVTGTDTSVPPVSSNEVVVPLTRSPAIALVKSAVSGLNEPAAPGEIITYTFEVTNTGNLDLTDVEIVDPLPGITPSSFTVGDLAPGETQNFTATYAIVAGDISAEKVENQATVTANYKDGPVSQPIDDPSGPTIDADEPVVVPVIPPAPALAIVKTGAYEDTDGSGDPTVGDRLVYRFVVTNTGNIPLDEVVPVDAGPTFNGLPATNTLSALTPTPLTLAPGTDATFTATYELSQDDIDNAAGIVDGVNNTAKAQGYRDGAVVPSNLVESTDSQALIALPAVAPSNISLTKQAGLRFIRIGEKAPYTITVTNNAVARVSGLTVTDVVPAGFRFVEGSATVDDVAVTPGVSGRNIVFENLALKSGGTVVIRLQLMALSTAGPGKHVNTAIATDEDGLKAAPDARASVEILAEPVFDCGEIIGKVFDDKNRDGYQDKGEPGLPSVRLATVNGVLVTTDAHGRFHVACADLPDQRIGSNFIMKLDTRTLPTGYRLTTENPRVVRLTAGKMTKLNFGAAIGRVVRLDLTDDAFEAGGVALQPRWSKGIDQLVDVLRQEVSVLRLSYVDARADRALANERLQHVGDLIRKRWRERKGQYRLEIETRVEVGQ
ncbi:SdrD B-like domain-containing protein [Aminobacter sp. AP02]|uniref:DUF7507 domain-containing protein n=1 Tax=Aminobacter sp. AP02 TaxID=2135737 RepID=UPI000D6B9ABD|nr:SdrD B-like domain-containing protein [Aminobacter sp. AP02]PWK73960.1 putative repeat protein (TIGR01451 family) [Aminobacter sp. AP02]